MDKNYYYKILGVPKTATTEEINTRFQKALELYRSVPGPENEEMVEDLLSAYQTLSDPEKRKQYDARQSGTKENNSTVSSPEKTECAADTPAMEEPRWSYSPEGTSAREEKRVQTVERIRSAEQAAKKIEDLIKKANWRPAYEPLPKKPGFISILATLLASVFAYLSVSYFGETFSVWMEYKTMACGAFGVFYLAWYVMRWAKYAYKKSRIQKRNEVLTANHLSLQPKLLQEAAGIQEKFQDDLDILPPHLRYSRAYGRIREFIETRRASDLTEALDTYERERYQTDTRAGIRTIQSSINILSETVEKAAGRKK